MGEVGRWETWKEHHRKPHDTRAIVSGTGYEYYQRSINNHRSGCMHLYGLSMPIVTLSLPVQGELPEIESSVFYH